MLRRSSHEGFCKRADFSSEWVSTMIGYENQCVGCQIHCDSTCPRKKVEVHFCDMCGCEYADYLIDGNVELCKSCAKKYLSDEYWSDRTVEEAARELEVEISDL